MKFFAVEVEGQNFLVNLNGRLAKHGFIAMRLVTADSEAEAATIAIDQTREFPGLRELVMNSEDDRPTMGICSIAELDSFEGINTEAGLVWYTEKRWWQFWKF